MNKNIFRFLSLVLCLLIVAAVVPFYSFVSVGDDSASQKPLLPVTCDKLISEAGNGDSKTFGAKYNALPANTRITLSSAIDLTDTKNFEFDVFVEDINNLVNAINNYPKEPLVNHINLTFSSAANAIQYLNQSALADISSQLTKSGWNHIKVLKSDFIENGIKWNKVKFVYLRFSENDSSNYPGSLADDKLSLVNVCTTVNAPEKVELFDFEPFSKNLGKNADSLYADISGEYKTEIKSALDLSNKQYLFVEFKPTNIDEFNNLLDAPRNLAFFLYTGENSAVATLSKTDIISRDGTDWKRLKISYDAFEQSTDFDWELVTGFSFGLTETTPEEKLGAAFSQNIVIAYVYADVDRATKPGINNNYKTVSVYYDNMASGNLAGNFSEVISFNTASSNLTGGAKETYNYDEGFYADKDTPVFDTLEFDLYVEDAELFLSATEKGSNTLRITFSSNEFTNDAHTVYVEMDVNELRSLINHSGWNHIVLDAYDKVKPLSHMHLFDFCAVTGCSVAFGGDIANANEASGVLMQIANICTTILRTPAPAMNNRYENLISSYYTALANAQLSNNFEMSLTKSTDAFDLTGTGSTSCTSAQNRKFQYIEFDLFVSNVQEFITACAKNKNTLKLRINSNNSYGENDCIIVELSQEWLSRFLLNDGWNHFAVICSGNHFSTKGSFDYAKATGWTLYFGGNTANTNDAKGQTIEISNIATTASTVSKPAVNNKYATVVDYYTDMEGTTLGSNFQYQKVVKHADNPVNWTGSEVTKYTKDNISSDGINKYFDTLEFDFHVDDANEFIRAISESGRLLRLRFYSDGQSGEKNCFTIEYTADQLGGILVNNGWNHITVDTDSKFSFGNEGKVNFANMTGWLIDFGGPSGATNIAEGQKMYIANISITNNPDVPNSIEPPELNNKYPLVYHYFKSVYVTRLPYNFGIQQTFFHNTSPEDWTASGVESYTKQNIINDAVNKYFDTLEFDFYTEDAAKLCNAVDTANRYLRLRFYSNGKSGETNCFTVELKASELREYLTNDGWNHIVLDTDSKFIYGNQGQIDFAKITGWLIDFGTPGADSNSASGVKIQISNICTTNNPSVPNAILPPDLNNCYKLVYPYFIKVYQTKIGSNFASQQVFRHNDQPVDWTASGVDRYTKTNIQRDIFNKYFDTLEFDFYVDNAKQFCDAVNSSQKTCLRLRFYSGGASGEKNCFSIELKGEELENKISKDGWNHVTIDSASEFSYGNQGAIDFTEITGWLIDFGGAIYDVNAAAGQKMSIANICVTDNPEITNVLEDPPMPENVITVIKERASKYLGAYFGYTSDGIYCEGIGPYDFSKGNAVEFDIYCTDAELFQKSVAECPRGAELAVVFSSTPLKLFSEYNKPRTYYSVYYNIQDKITKTGWNHIKIAKSDFSALAHTMNWANVTSYMLRYNGSKWNTVDPEEKNPAGEVQMRFANVVNTGLVSTVPYDSDKPLTPDKSAVYISSGEELVDDNGSWNPTGVFADTNYKTEGKASMMRKVNYETKREFARMFYLFDSVADMSDIKELKVDFFVDISKLVKKSGNKISIGLSADRGGSEGTYYWNIDVKNLKDGWNSLALDISSANKEGNISLSSIKSVFVRFDSLNLDPENFESVTIGMDNLRYISKTGRKTLKIASTSGEDETEFFDDAFIEQDETDESLHDEDYEQPVTTLRTTIRKIITNYTLTTIILVAEFILLSIATVIGVILVIKKKKNKKSSDL